MAGKHGSIRLTKSGRLAVDNALMSLIEQNVALEEASHAALEVTRAHTPILTGRLRAGWRAGKKHWLSGGRGLFLQIINHVFYGPFVNRRGKSKGFADRGIAEGLRVAKQVIAQKRPLSRIIRQMWRATK